MPAAGVVPASGAYDQITWDFITWAKMVAPPRRRPLGSGCHSSVDQPASHRASHGLYLLDVPLGGLVRARQVCSRWLAGVIVGTARPSFV